MFTNLNPHIFIQFFFFFFKFFFYYFHQSVIYQQLQEIEKILTKNQVNPANYNKFTKHKFNVFSHLKISKNTKFRQKKKKKLDVRKSKTCKKCREFK